MYGVQKAISLSFLMPNLDICSGQCETPVVDISNSTFIVESADPLQMLLTMLSSVAFAADWGPELF